MRALITTSLLLATVFQVGCTTAAIKTAHQKHEVSSKVAKRYLAARRLEQRGKFEPAREIYSDLLLQHPQNPDIQHRLAVVCTRLHRYGEAQSLYTRALKRDPKNATLLTDMGYFYYLRGDSVEAELILSQALHVRPDDLRATSNLALVVGRQGRVDECLKLLRQVHDEPNALSNLAYIHHLRGEEDLAKQRYREAVELEPNLNEASVALAELTKLYPDISVADFVPPVQVSDEPARLPISSDIQQVSAVAGASQGVVQTASFTTETAADEELPVKPVRPRAATSFEATAAEPEADDTFKEPRKVHRDDFEDSSDTDDAESDWSTGESAASKSAGRSSPDRVIDWDVDAPREANPFDVDAGDQN